MKQGPNVKRLIIHKMVHDAVPPGNKDGLAAGIAFLSSPEAIAKAAREATDWVEAAIAAVRAAAEPNRWKSASDEEIAAELLSQIERRLKRS